MEEENLGKNYSLDKMVNEISTNEVIVAEKLIIREDKIPEHNLEEHAQNEHGDKKQLTCFHSTANIKKLLTNIMYTAKKLNVTIKNLGDIHKSWKLGMFTNDAEKKVEFNVYLYVDKQEDVLTLDFMRKNAVFLFDFYEIRDNFINMLKFLEEVLNIPEYKCI